MTTNNEAFEATYPVPDGIWFHSDGDYINKDDTPNEYNNMWHTWQAATTEANKRIAELERDVAELKDTLDGYDEIMDADDKRIVELQASNNDLQEALELLFDTQNGCPLPKYENDWNKAMRLSKQALSATPAESLQAHVDELIERCIDVLERYRGFSGLEVIEAIRALKGQ